MSVNFPSNPQKMAAINITEKFKRASDQITGKVVHTAKLSLIGKIKQKFAASVIKPDITYKDLSALTGKTYLWNRSNSKISFNEMTSIIKDSEVFDKFTDEQKITLIISYNNMKNKLTEGSSLESTSKIKKIFKDNVYKSDGDKAQDVIKKKVQEEVPRLIQNLKNKIEAHKKEKEDIEKKSTETPSTNEGKLRELVLAIGEAQRNIESLEQIR